MRAVLARASAMRARHLPLARCEGGPRQRWMSSRGTMPFPLTARLHIILSLKGFEKGCRGKPLGKTLSFTCCLLLLKIPYKLSLLWLTYYLSGDIL